MSTEESTSDCEDAKASIRIVGIGASAGGLEALEIFFDHMAPTTGMAFVIVQHLSPHYKSFMSELLSRHTAMQINVVESATEIKPNQIYLIPPQHYMTVQHGRLLLTPYAPEKAINLPIDAFFTSLAAEQGEHAIGVILSGTGTDGTRGVQAIHHARGMVLVQNEETAKFDGMPKSAIATGIVNFVLTTEQLAEKVVGLAMTKESVELDDSVDQEWSKSTEEQLSPIFAALKQQTGIDFSGYKQAGVLRRIERRMKMKDVQTLKEYMLVLQNDPGEVSSLQGDMLIGVTHFFRDPEAFAVIYNQVIPGIVQHKLESKETDIRVWVAGCSTGEEAYTLAMLFLHYVETHRLNFNIRIFATDLDKDSINYASQGIYPDSLAEEVPSEYVDKYFVKKGDAYQVNKDLRKLVVFAPHNIIKDPPFVNLDLVSCRNMMIYFQGDVQKKVLSLFHFALHKKGYLFLGPSESIGKMTHLYEPVNKKWNIYLYNEKLQVSLANALEITRTIQESPVLKSEHPLTTIQESVPLRKLDDIFSTMIDEYMPPSIIIDSQDEVVHTYGNVNKYLSMPRGKVSLNIHRMLTTQLSVVVGTGVHRVRKERQTVTYKDIRLPEDFGFAYIDLIVKPFSSTKSNGLILIMFEEVKQRLEPSEYALALDLETNASLRIRDLERELEYAKESLQATIEELETSNEELQSTNEELIASNEELQSTNEELQSVNEELISVNTEHQRKIQELTELNNDMDNFLISTKIGTIFLDREMRIRRFTPAVTSVIHLMEVDIGRPINHISHLLKYDALLEDAKTVLANVQSIEKEIQSKDGRWFSMGILPYRTIDNFIKGVVITFVDISDLKMANKELQKLSYAIYQSPSSILITDAAGRIEYVNPKFTERTGYTQQELLGQELRSLHELDESSASMFQDVWTTLGKGRKWVGEWKNRRKNGQQYWEEASFIPIKDEEGETIHLLKASEDITERKRTEELLRKSEMHSAVGQLAAGIAHEIRNPLTALKGFLQLIEADGEKNDTYIKIMMSEFNRIETIINELLLLSKPHALSFQPGDLLVILNDVLMLLESQALMNQVLFQTELEEDLPAVECVENQIKQVFINILKNAIEAMPNGGNIRVIMRRQSDEAVLIQMIDNGVGIPEEFIERLGEPFYTTKDKGTGLGMMVSHKIIENHRGNLSIRSKVGEGTCVEILLPFVSQ